jgi:hypothetical protein
VCSGTMQVLGDEMVPLLAPLSSSQLKLVTIYVQRAQAARQTS